MYEGEITEGDLETVKNKLDVRIEPGESVVVYWMSSDKYATRSVFGEVPAADNQSL